MVTASGKTDDDISDVTDDIFSAQLGWVDAKDEDDNEDDNEDNVDDDGESTIFLTSVGPSWVRQREGREQDIHRQGTDGASRRERGVERNDCPIYDKI